LLGKASQGGAILCADLLRYDALDGVGGGEHGWMVVGCGWIGEFSLCGGQTRSHAEYWSKFSYQRVGVWTLWQAKNAESVLTSLFFLDIAPT